MIRFTSTQIGIGARGPYYRVDFNDEVLVPRTFKPFHDACRALVARGLTGPAEQWSGGKHIMSSRDITRSALLTVVESEAHGPRITKYVPFGNSAEDQAARHSGHRARRSKNSP